MKTNKLQLHATAKNLTHIMFRETSQTDSVIQFHFHQILTSRLEMRIAVTFREDREGPYGWLLSVVHILFLKWFVTFTW